MKAENTVNLVFVSFSKAKIYIEEQTGIVFLVLQFPSWAFTKDFSLETKMIKSKAYCFINLLSKCLLINDNTVMFHLSLITKQVLALLCEVYNAAEKKCLIDRMQFLSEVRRVFNVRRDQRPEIVRVIYSSVSDRGNSNSEQPWGNRLGNSRKHQNSVYPE